MPARLTRRSPLRALSLDTELAHRLEHDARFRRRYMAGVAQCDVAAAIRALRHTRGLRQVDLATRLHTQQSAIARLEAADYDGWTFKTLLALADALGARVRITFEPIEDVASHDRSPALLAPVPEQA